MSSVLEASEIFTGDYATDFETWSEFYDSTPELQVLAEHADLTNRRVLEAGCGSGRLTFRLGSETERFVAVDIVPSLIDLCQDRLAQQYLDLVDTHRFEVQDLHDLPYPDGAFDTLLDGWTYSTLKDPDTAEEEYRRVLGEDGTILSIQEREGSDYQSILLQFAPEEYRYDAEQEIDQPLREAFGEPVVEEDIVAPYRFDSVETAYDVLLFNFVEWMEIELDRSDRRELKTELEKYEQNGRVTIDEFARFYKFTVN